MEKPDCICKLLKTSNRVYFDPTPVIDIPQPDKTNVLNIGKIMALIHYPRIKNKSWDVEVEDKHYNVCVIFAPDTTIDDKQIELIKQVNPLLIKRIWVQPEKNDLLLCASVWRSDVDRSFTVQDIYIIERTINGNNPNTTKRIKLESNTKRDDDDSD